MFPAWLKASTLMLVAVALMASPCRNCAPAEQRQAPAPAHDCCPKPAPVPPCHQPDAPQCAWQPNDAPAQIEKEIRLSGLLECGCAADLAAAPGPNMLFCTSAQPTPHAGSPPGEPAYLIHHALRR